MKERPIIFSGPMVRAILAGTKTQTRRIGQLRKVPSIAKLVSNAWDGCFCIFSLPDGSSLDIRNPYSPGDRLWVRETWGISGCFYDIRIFYRIDDPADPPYTLEWRSPIHMPRWASRITLEVVSVRAERVQDISINDAIAESILEDYHGWRSEATNVFEKYWDSLNAKRGHSWASNPWVWAIEFKRVEEGE